MLVLLSVLSRLRFIVAVLAAALPFPSAGPPLVVDGVAAISGKRVTRMRSRKVMTRWALHALELSGWMVDEMTRSRSAAVGPIKNGAMNAK